MSENQVHYVYPETLPTARNAGSPRSTGPSGSGFWKYVLTAFVAASLTFAIVAGGALFYYNYLKSNGLINDGRSVNLRFDSGADTRTALVKLETVLKYISDNYYEELTDAEILEAMTEGLVGSLGNPYTMYLTAEENEMLRQAMSGNYSGIGAFVGINKDGLVEITEVIQGSPAEEAGILPGDLFVEVDGQDVTSIKDTTDVAILVRGEEGTTVDIVMYRPSIRENVSMTVTRRKITTSNISSRMLSPTIGYIAIRDFSQGVAANFVEAVIGLQAQGAEHIVFDLRNNTGGLANEVVGMLDYLLPEGIIATLKGRRDGQEYTEYWPSDDQMYVPESMSYAIVTNSFTASASELFAGCLRDNGEAKIFGGQTFGKGSGTVTYELEDGSAVNLTTFLYYLPNGESIEGTGLTPDEMVDLPEEAAGKAINQLTIDQDTQLKAALAYLESLD